MVDKKYLLTSGQMASFTARGFLRFDELVPQEMNEAVMRQIDEGTITRAPAGTPLSQCYPPPSAIGDVLRMNEIQGIVQSLVGPEPLFDHHAIHVRQPNQGRAQGLHGDSIIDTRMHFDIQLMYFPHDVPLEMGGTLLVPGTQYRRINEHDIARYQNMLGQIPHGLQSGDAAGPPPRDLALWPSQRDGPHPLHVQDSPETPPCANCACGIPTTWKLIAAIKCLIPIAPKKKNIVAILGKGEPWFEFATGRLEYVNRIKMWRFLTGDEKFDVRYWLTRLENMPENLPLAA